jgi:pimeloyl-ACP methyl ester carboxylesterase
MLAQQLDYFVQRAIGHAATAVDVMLIRVALAVAQCSKRQRLREIAERRRHYEDMAERYAAIDPLHFYARPEPIRLLRERRIASLPGGAVFEKSWSSGYEPRLATVRDSFLRWHTNGIVHARAFRHFGAPPRAAVVWIHGYRGGLFAVEQRICRALALFARGLDVVLYTLPFHSRRAPLGAVRAPLFPDQGDVALTNEGFGQIIWEIRGLLRWLRAQGAPAVGVMGMSLGGYCASLLATVEPELDFAINFLPLADFTDAVVAHEALRGIAIDPAVQLASRRALAIHRPLARTAVIPGERVLVIGGKADRITGRVHAEQLAAHFGSEVIWFAGGHILQYGRGAALRAAMDFAARHARPSGRRGTT